jgi:hypothetical protein
VLLHKFYGKRKKAFCRRDLHMGTVNTSRNVQMINVKDKIEEKQFIVMKFTP